MLTTTVIACLLQCVGAVCASSTPHERRHDDGWKAANVFNRRRINSDTILPIRIALRENEHARTNAESWLLDVSHPHSERYGRHWSQEDIIHAFRPADESLEAVTKWLHDHGIFDFTHTDNQLWFAFDLSASRAERLLRTEFYEYEIRDGNGQFVRLDVASREYYLPENVKDHIDFVTPGVQSRDITDRTETGTALRKRSVRLAAPKKQSFRSVLPRSNHKVPGVCHGEVTPACVRAMYGIPLANTSQPVSENNTMGFAEFQNDLYNQQDLDTYFDRYTNIPNGTSPIFRGIDGATTPAEATPFELEYSAESDTDIETALAIIYPQNATVFQVSSHGNSDNYYNRLLDALDGSYCTPQQSKNAAGGGKPQCGIYKPTNIISMSWGSAEYGFSKLWQRRQCNEYLKLGLQGVSILVASGDDGVSLIPHTGEGKNICPNGTKFSTGVFSPNFPASCPWVTAVGGTQLPNNHSLAMREEAFEVYVRNPSTNGSKYAAGSGGGFSNRFDQPQYQQSAVEHFFKTANPQWKYYTDGKYNGSTGRYNRNGRGYPDISASAKDMPVCFNSSHCVAYGGTSYATPLCGAIFNRIIEERIRIGKGPLGFLNPTLYQHPEVFTDILKGGNGVCSPADGFECAEGWDPVTGLGTPRYPELLQLFLKLP